MSEVMSSNNKELSVPLSTTSFPFFGQEVMCKLNVMNPEDMSNRLVHCYSHCSALSITILNLIFKSPASRQEELVNSGPRLQKFTSAVTFHLKVGKRH